MRNLGYKKYTDQDKKLHPIVKDLKDKGHLRITVEWNHATASNYSRGWKIYTSHIPYKRHFGTVKDLIQEIKNSTPVTNDQNKESEN